MTQADRAAALVVDLGLGVSKAPAGIASTITPALSGADADDQRMIDDTLPALDPSPLKATLGGTATVAVSMAVLQAAAASARRGRPSPGYAAPPAGTGWTKREQGTDT